MAADLTPSIEADDQPAPDSAAEAARPLDAVALRRVLTRLHAAPTAPWLHDEVGKRMAERLGIVRLQPQTVLEWAPHVGGGSAGLHTAYPKARFVAVEPLPAARKEPVAETPWWSLRRLASLPPPALAPLDVAAAMGQLLWSNMGLHGAVFPQKLMRLWHRALAVDGFLMFSTLGPGTLEPLRSLYRAAGWAEPYAPFVDMHDLGDMLVAAGFADPVMDQESITLTWDSADACLSELRSLGGNVALQRYTGLRTPRWRQRLGLALQEQAQTSRDGRIALSFEIVYGHAFKPPPRPRLASETAVPLEDMRAMMRAGRRPG